jgi:hypothetical protein
MRPVFVVCVVLSSITLAGCSGASSGPGGQASSPQQQARAVWAAYARCVRAHGYPDFPDPQVNSLGKPIFAEPAGAKSIGLRMQGTCGPILRRLPAAAQGRTPVTPAELRQEVLFAGCMRRHGLPEWPDPRPDGSFPLASTPYAHMGKSGPVLAALQACQRYDTFGGIKGAGS